MWLHNIASRIPWIQGMTFIRHFDLSCVIKSFNFVDEPGNLISDLCTSLSFPGLFVHSMHSLSQGESDECAHRKGKGSCFLSLEFLITPRNLAYCHCSCHNFPDKQYAYTINLDEELTNPKNVSFIKKFQNIISLVKIISYMQLVPINIHLPAHVVFLYWICN